ncbi:MAG TPA: hypothetical protein EYO73_10530 [Sulfurimonas sp.]|nr:hypothetical protein [Sulfurimonas sp.]
MTQDHIINFLSTNKAFIQKKFNVKKIGLFGSYASNKQTLNSDIDILVDMPSSFDNFYGLKEYLENNLEKTIDLGLEKKLRNLIKQSVKNEVIYV